MNASTFTIKDSGARKEFDSGMVRDTDEGKTNFLSIRIGPMYQRWAAHLTKGRVKYPDVAPGVPNWTLADGPDELARARESAARHFEAWLAGEKDEDHASGVYFNINLAEYVEEKLADKTVTYDGSNFTVKLSTDDAAGINLPTEPLPALRCVLPTYIGSPLCPDSCAITGKCRGDRPGGVVEYVPYPPIWRHCQ